MCWPEHMWRTGPAFSPSRARRAAVSASSGSPSAAGEERLADAGAAVEALERSDVEVLARVRAGHDRDLGRLEIEGLDPAGLDEREQPERLDRRAQGHEPVGSPSWRMIRPATSASTMSPRWTLSSMPLRSWRARIGATTRPRAPERRARGSRRTRGGGDGGGGHDRWSSGGCGQLVTLGARGYRDDCYDGRREANLVARRSPRLPMTAPTLHVSQHPAVLHKLAILRDERPSRRSSARSCASCRGCSATRRSRT